MPRRITLTEDGPLGKAGDEVWVNDEPEQDKKPPAKKTAPAKKTDK